MTDKEAHNITVIKRPEKETARQQTVRFLRSREIMSQSKEETDHQTQPASAPRLGSGSRKGGKTKLKPENQSPKGDEPDPEARK